MSTFWNKKRVVVTGGAGFLGTPMTELLRARGAEVVIPRKKEYNFVDFTAAKACMEAAKPHIVIHAAAYYGGIWINQLYPGRIYFENLVMGANAMEAARLAGVEKFVGIGTACSYPGYLDGTLREDQLWNGIPHETVVNYGTTKKMMAIQGLAYRKQYDFRSIHLILTNLYGPGDTFNPDRSHVVSALIRKFVEAVQQKKSEVEIWGTGKPIREFMYVRDCAEGVLLAAEHFDDPEPMNLGNGVGVSIRELAETIRDISRFGGKLTWNTTKPDGQMKKILDVDKMKKILNWTPPTSLRKGLEETIAWYAANKELADARA